MYIAESPLFEITHKGNTYFAYDEKEKAKILSGLDGKVTIQRSKGLGENEPEMMWQTTMNPATRRLIRITTDEAQKTAEYFETLLGDDLEARKAIIAEKGHLYLDELDLE